MPEPVFPVLPGLTFPVVKTPMWKTEIQEAVSGKETRLGFWSYPIWKYSLSYAFLRSDSVNLELQQLIGFYNARNGPFEGFLFLDPDDQSVVDQNFGTGNGTNKIFQLSRTYGGWTEPVKAPGTISNIKVAGVATGAYTLDTLTGILTFTTAPANGAALTWTGSYYWRCRFLEDQQEVSKFVAAIWEAQAVEFRSIK